jgi:sn-glycerol 3-phosphate transport system substrate-binding protein
VVSYYQTSDGELLSMPFNSSTPVLWYNADALKAAGASVPTTWDEVESAAKALVANGMDCGYSFGWQSWVMIENFSAWHDISMGTKENGFTGFDTEFTFNNDKVANRSKLLPTVKKTNCLNTVVAEVTLCRCLLMANVACG